MIIYRDLADRIYESDEEFKQKSSESPLQQRLNNMLKEC